MLCSLSAREIHMQFNDLLKLKHFCARARAKLWLSTLSMWMARRMAMNFHKVILYGRKLNLLFPGVPSICTSSMRYTRSSRIVTCRMSRQKF